MNDKSFCIKTLAKSKIKYFDKNGIQISQDDYSLLLENLEYRIVKQTPLGKYFISTVWIGLDRSPFFSRNLPPPHTPQIFETMIFCEGEFNLPTPNGLEVASGYLELYATEEEAVAGHEKAVKYVKETLTQMEK